MRRTLIILLLLCATANLVHAQDAPSFRVLRPIFDETFHEPPAPGTPGPRENWLEYIDIAALALALVIATYFALQSRSRRGLLLLSMACLLYFGFWRKGCICPVGSVQNMWDAFLHPDVALPAIVIAFFSLPLIFTLFAGRTFCAAVCPLGAIQELTLFRPVQLPTWISHSLGLFRYVYLGLALTLVATGATYLVCSLDPFIAIFRFGGTFPMLVFGATVLAIGMFIGRPYCRFLCPYGAILGLLSMLSRWHVTITPDDCVNCRLCEDACPYGAIRPANDTLPTESLPRSRTRLAGLLALLPALVLSGAILGAMLAQPLSYSHKKIKLLHLLQQEGLEAINDATIETEAWRRGDQTYEELVEETNEIRRSFRSGSIFFCSFVGFVFGAKLISLSILRRRKDYTPDPATCMSCGRCYKACPIENERLKEKNLRP
ncbi:MAG: 4Fe-4S binding protein [Kiritimatiellae bacterium]|nr:4Fe-4S binding protein [Kiritimatiellia bacterium]